MLQFFMLGLKYGWGNMSVYIASYLKLTDPSIRSTDLTLGLSITIMFQALTLWIAPILFRNIENHRLIIIGANLVGVGGVFLSSYMTTVIGVLMTFNVGWGIQLGVGYMTPIQCSLLWFPEHKGLISGLIIGMLGLSAIFINSFINVLVNPEGVDPSTDGDDRYFERDIAEGTPAMLRSIAYVFAVMSVLVVLLCFKPTPPSVPGENTTVTVTEENQNDEFGVHENVPQVSWRWKAMYSKHFFWVFVNNIFSMGSASLILGLYQSHGFIVGYSVAFMTAIGFIGALCNGFGRIILAFVAEKYTYKGTYLSIAFTQLIALILLASVENVYVYVIANAAMFWGIGGHYVNTIVYFNKIYDKQYAGELYGYYFFSFLISNMINIPLKMLYKETSYLFMIMLLIGLNTVCIVSLMVNFDFEDRKINLENEKDENVSPTKI